ncbi:MAG TPA: hypothetical protein VLF89_01685 [Candidatus Saccharimonadales bacterium]|nr:hypothetical protein [Candidatus Saccharimonadales bacterium]
MDKKKLIYGVIAVVFVIGIGISYYLTAQPSQSTSNHGNQIVSPSPIDNGVAKTTKNTQSDTATTPEDTTKAFYEWYMHYPQDVIRTGAYENSPYLTDTFKKHITGFATHYNPQFDPIFCTANKTKNYEISSGTVDGNNIDVLITDKNVDAPKPLYNVVLVQVNGQWQINDITCE